MTDSQDQRLANLLGALALGLSDAMRESTEAAADQTGAGPAAIVGIDEFLDGANVDRLRQFVDVTPSGGVRLVDRLVDDGLVVRRPGADARSLALRLTAKGRRVATRVRAARARPLERAVATLTSKERAQLTVLLEKLITAVVTDRLEARATGEVPTGGWLCRLCDADACGRPEGRCPAQLTAHAAAGDPRS